MTAHGRTKTSAGITPGRRDGSGAAENSGVLKRILDDLYRRYNRRQLVHPDPLEFLYDYSKVEDREIVGLVASSLAYGRVSQILCSVEKVLAVMGQAPRSYIDNANRPRLRKDFEGFRHRFTTGADLADMLWGVKRIIQRHGSLQACFESHLAESMDDMSSVQQGFVQEIHLEAGRDLGHVLPMPANGSACKRLNLYLRWMCRSDEVDPGGWTKVPRTMLRVPVDTHMHAVGRTLGFTERNSADVKTVSEITLGFKNICPQDPVKYDFALTRPGIWGDAAWLLGRLKKSSTKGANAGTRPALVQ